LGVRRTIMGQRGRSGPAPRGASRHSRWIAAMRSNARSSASAIAGCTDFGSSPATSIGS
jgi:hypothetical protein